jgi:hypothetical protein
MKSLLSVPLMTVLVESALAANAEYNDRALAT